MDLELNEQMGFYVRFLGSFSLWFEGREVPVKANPMGKTMQMLFFLLKAGSSGTFGTGSSRREKPGKAAE